MPHRLCTEDWLRTLAAARGIAALPEGWLYGVRSTGVACRPGCQSREPKPENVVLPLTAETARAAGFRPCRRCRPYP